MIVRALHGALWKEFSMYELVKMYLAGKSPDYVDGWNDCGMMIAEGIVKCKDCALRGDPDECPDFFGALGDDGFCNRGGRE